MTRLFQIDIIALPLMFIPIIILTQVLFSIQLYNKLQKKDELFAAIGYTTAFILALIPYRWATGVEIDFWSAPFHWSLIAVVLAVLTRLFSTKQISTIQQVAFGVAIALLLVSLPMYDTSGGTVAGGLILLLSLFLLCEQRNGRFTDIVIPYALLGVALLGFVGHWIPYNGGRFLFGFLLLAIIGYELFYYIGRIISLLQAATISSVTDSLTGLYSYNYLLRKANKIAEKQEIEVLHVTINDFSLYTKEHGQVAGKSVLTELGSLIREVFGEEGFACHLGEQQFIGVIHIGHGEELAGRLQRQIAKKTPVTATISCTKGKGDISALLQHKRVELAS